VSRAATDRRRPTAYVARPVANSPGRRVLLSTGRGDTRLSTGEAVGLALELLAVAADLDPAAAADVTRMELALAERVAAQSELLAACAKRRGGAA
jgi:hypothetical protein